MSKYVWVFVVTGLVVGAFFAQDALASASAGEDKIVGVIERILNVVADFFERIFQSIADAVKSIFSGDDSAKK
ncbi:MAG: uncharacterized membrane protein YtjA (UPF0391 family) [Alphaproteobacteria bacterium]|jgi:uncharacterized membrane protein YtjA (UPF0391 family)